VRLVGVAALAPEVNAAKNLVRLQPGSDAFKAALATLQQINGCAPALAIAVRSLGTQVCGPRISCKVVSCSRVLLSPICNLTACGVWAILGKAHDFPDTRCTHAAAAAF
jgi:hypothetical protein